MVKKQIKRLKGQFFYLMISLVLLLLSYPFFKSSSLETFFSWFVGLLVFGAAIYADSDNKQHFFVALALGIIYLGFSFLSLFSNSKFLALLSVISSVIFFLFTIFLIIESMLKKHEVTPNTIYGAISVYLLIGFIFANVFTFVLFVDPISLSSPTITSLSHGDTLFFSFVTLTTLGYGDIFPASSLAQSLSVFEAVFGQLYLAILVALLISNFIPKQYLKPKKRKFIQKKLK